MERLITGHFRIGSNLPGAPLFKLSLSFLDGHAHGQGTITQAVNPPLDIHSHLRGTSALIVSGADTRQIITLTGHEFVTPMPPNPVNVECSMYLDSKQPGTGMATYRYLDEKKQWVDVQNVPVKVTWIPVE
ncbi:MAG: DUF1842 domain-containing protein [Collimonas sp.]|uniref:DUF1842 domain-containing protein n=1 Tax=Collimonas sp. TaxID=1963772 RepID=UPI003265065D